MVRVITQETFDDVVKENIEEFAMSKEEAIKEAKEQFESQGVNLANIVMSLEEDSEVVQALDGIKKSCNSGDIDKIENLCQKLSFECRKGLAEKSLCTKNDGYKILVKIANPDFPNNTNANRASAIRALAALLDRNSDLLDVDGFVVILKGFEDVSDSNLVGATLELILSSVVMHEGNRVNLMNNRILDLLDTVCEIDPVGVARIWQAIIQDDDLRVEFGKTHDTARDIVENHKGLQKLSAWIEDSFDNYDNLYIYLACMSSLTLRNEYCQYVVDAGGLKTIMGILVNPDRPKKIVAAALRLLKTLAGNDDIKKVVADTGGISIVANSITNNMSNVNICRMGCESLSNICLRMPGNAKQVMDHGGAQLFTQILKTHKDNAKVLIACCMAIRNVVSRSKQFSLEFVALDIENLLNEIKKTHPQAEDVVRAALRDMNLKVHLKEEWKGSSSGNVTDSTETSISDFPLTM